MRYFCIKLIYIKVKALSDRKWGDYSQFHVLVFHEHEDIIQPASFLKFVDDTDTAVHFHDGTTMRFLQSLCPYYTVCTYLRMTVC